jgi:RHS repeat-associated protein
VVDTHAGTITADHSYFWCGSVRCLAHDNTQSGSPVSTQYFSQGIIVSGTAYYYLKDALGSVRALLTSTSSVVSQYTYDPYGNQTVVSGTLVSDIGYAGYFYHAVSGLDFAMYRAYDPTHARWMNRDPIGEAGGHNLYAYAAEDPTSLMDPLGFCPNPNKSVWSLLASSPGLLAIVIATEVIGGGPEDPLADAAVAAEIAAAEGAVASEGAAAALLDTNAVIAAVEGGNAAAVDAALAGATPYVSPTVIAEFTAGGGDMAELEALLSARGGGMLAAETEGDATALQSLATSMGRSLGANDAAIASAARSAGMPVITNDSQFLNFLKASGIGGSTF